jgi:coenzyme Q-binding protein COQ10
MPSYRTQRRVHHTAAHMFALVADVEAYPQFVPMCQKLKVLKRDLDEQGDPRLVAQMEVGFKAIRESFTSRVVLREAARRIEVDYIDGPFRQLHNVWSFADEAEAGWSRVEFSIDYEFRSRTLAMLMGSMFDAAFRRFAQAFEERADKVYGRA